MVIVLPSISTDRTSNNKKPIRDLQGFLGAPSPKHHHLYHFIASDYLMIGCGLDSGRFEQALTSSATTTLFRVNPVPVWDHLNSKNAQIQPTKTEG